MIGNLFRVSLILLPMFTTHSLAQNIKLEGPKGDVIEVAKRIIFVDAEQPCGKLLTATRTENNIILARCSNGERYIVGVVRNAPMKDGSRKDIPIAMKCSLSEKILGHSIKGC